jgi:hypothetical protein
MLQYIREDKNQIFWLVFHALVGFASVQTKFALIIWMYMVCVGFLVSLTKSKDYQFEILSFLTYILGIEVLARGLKCAPFIPHELGKYCVVIFIGYGLLKGGQLKKVSSYGVAMLLLSIPALFVGQFRIKSIVFNYLGPLGLFLGVIFCAKQVVTYKQFLQLCRLMLYSIFMLACYTIFRASTFEKIDYNLLANYEAAGGSITNQVSTLFGTAIVVIVLMYLTRQKLFKYKFIDIGLLLLFTMRGLLTFSRGGMISAAMAIIIMLLIPKATNSLEDNELKVRKVPFSSVILIAFAVVVSFLFINAVTNNYLLYRYQGRTERSLQTGFANKVDLDQISSGRFTIMRSDLNMFLAYPALGTGIGESVRLRPNHGGGAGINSHLEFSRLLAEHGILGLIIVIMMYLVPFIKIFYERNYYKRLIMVVFLVMALSVTFHNAMRTMITPLLFALAFLNIVPTDYDWKKELTIIKRRWLYSPRQASEMK